MSRQIAIVGAGRLGTVLARALATDPPLGRGAVAHGADVVLLCVPDAEIAAASAAVAPGPLVGHCSGASTLDPLLPHEAFGLHPLMTVAPGASPAVLHGAGCAVVGSTPRALATARELAERLGMDAVAIADADRAAYHAAASMASNFLVALEAAAERIGASAGLDRARLVPLVRATVDNWAALGPQRALTGPIARGDAPTVERHRGALRERAPELLPLYDALAATTRELAGVAA
jgi:predicted short-subunit dehydrogenase-like oxidoreductase (DUF2520 family)